MITNIEIAHADWTEGAYVLSAKLTNELGEQELHTLAFTDRDLSQSPSNIGTLFGALIKNWFIGFSDFANK